MTNLMEIIGEKIVAQNNVPGWMSGYDAANEYTH
jgi:hypothetical protein